MRELTNGNRNLPVFTHKSADQAERELILRALYEMKGDIMEIKHFFQQQHEQALAVSPRYDETPVEMMEHENGDGVLPMEEMERRMIINALERFAGNRRLAAKALRISERTLYRKIKEYNLE